jgi:hypothetical protein
MTNRIYRICMPVSLNPVITPTTIPGMCSKCHEPVWVEATQKIPDYALQSAVIIVLCLLCAMQDEENFPNLFETLQLHVQDVKDFGMALPRSAATGELYRAGKPPEQEAEPEEAG